jgi:tetratricopeptide (TPR) repeat protein
MKGMQEHRLRTIIVLIDDFTMAIDLNSNNAVAYFKRGTAEAHKGSYEGAIADLTKAIELNPNFAVAFDNRGVIKRNKGDCGSPGRRASLSDGTYYGHNFTIPRYGFPRPTPKLHTGGNARMH